LPVTCLAPFVLCLWAAAQYSLDWFSLDGGGGTSTGGVYSVSGTIGQPEAGTMSGGNFTLTGGFWDSPVPFEPPVVIHIRMNAEGTITVDWNHGGTLQTAPTLLGTWQDVRGVTSPYTFIGTAQILFLRVRF
jgi:hypothetical protein